jgi:hypothetical protein
MVLLKAHCPLPTRTGGPAARAPARLKPFVQWPHRGPSAPASTQQLGSSPPVGPARAPAPATPRSRATARAAAMAGSSPAAAAQGPALICTSVTATTVKAFLEEIREAEASGVDVVELRLDFIADFDPERDLDALLAACTIPYIVTYRPKWEG